MAARLGLRSPLILALLASCSSTPNREFGDGSTRPRVEPPAPAPSAQAHIPSQPTGETGRAQETDRDEPQLVARVAGLEITAGELLTAWMQKDSRAVRATIEELILSRIVVLEAERLGLALEETLIEEAFAGVQARLEEEVRRTGAGMDVEEFVRRRLGLDPLHYMQRLRRESELDLLATRVVRSWLLASERAELRVIVVSESAEADQVKQRLDSGEDFSTVAAECSIENTAEVGGRVPPVVRGPTALARLAFSTPVGAVGGPVTEGGKWLLLKVDSRPAVLSGSWRDVADTVQASLTERQIEDPEYWQWKADVLLRYEVDMQPFLELVGEIVAD